jgi:predicted ribosome quality control (RQC) complex YloA/Tae2 family protein
LEIEDIFILGVGRHFRIAGDLKLIVGRDETENNFLGHYAKDHWMVKVSGFAGPTAVIMGEFGDSDLVAIARVVARYSDGKQEPAVEVRFSYGDQVKAVTTEPATGEFLEAHRV